MLRDTNKSDRPAARFAGHVICEIEFGNGFADGFGPIFGGRGAQVLGTFEEQILLLFRLREETQIQMRERFGRFARTLIQRLDLKLLAGFVEQEKATC